MELAPNRASSGGCELTGSYVARCSGSHHLAVVYRGEHIKGSPWQVPHVAHPWPHKIFFSNFSLIFFPSMKGSPHHVNSSGAAAECWVSRSLVVLAAEAYAENAPQRDVLRALRRWRWHAPPHARASRKSAASRSTSSRGGRSVCWSVHGTLSAAPQRGTMLCPSRWITPQRDCASS